MYSVAVSCLVGKYLDVSYFVLKMKATHSHHISVSQCVEDTKQYKEVKQTVADLLVLIVVARVLNQ